MLFVRDDNMKRGQAFETMMLVISVIVAVAILGILLMFIGKIGPFGMTDARTAMQSCLREVHTRGYGLCMKESVNFKAGDIVLRKELLMDVPIPETSLTFQCKDKDICTKDLILLDSKGTRINVGSGISAHIAACTDGKNYAVTISRDNQKVSEDCLAAVKIK